MNVENEDTQELDDSIDTQDDAGMEPGTPDQVHEPDDYEIETDEDSDEPDVQQREDSESADEASEQVEHRPHGQTVPLRVHDQAACAAGRGRA